MEATPASRAVRQMWLPATVALLMLLPILAAHHLPLLDAPAHEARLAVLHDALLGGRPSAYYHIRSFLVPNIGFDVIGLGLTTLFDAETAGRVFFAITLLLMLSGLVVLNRAASGRWSLVPLVASLAIYNLITIFGFLSYLFGLALVPWALALRLKLRSHPPAVAFIAGAASGLLLLFCHVFAFAIYTTMSVGFALTGALRREVTPSRLVLWTLEPLPAVALFFATAVKVDSKVLFEKQYLPVKLWGLLDALTAGSFTADMAFAAGAVAVLALFSVPRVRLVPGFAAGLILLFLIYFALPFGMATGGFVDKRLPIAIGLLLLAGLDVEVRRSAVATAAVAVIAMALVVKQVALGALWRSFDPLIDQTVSVLGKLPRGAVLLQPDCQDEARSIMAVYRDRQPFMVHVPALASMDGALFVADNWAIRGQQPIAVRPAYRDAYEMQDLFRGSTCNVGALRAQLMMIRTLKTGPAYFFVARPPQPRVLADEARLVATGRDFELYAAD